MSMDEVGSESFFPETLDIAGGRQRPAIRQGNKLRRAKLSLITRVRRLRVYPYHTWDEGSKKSESYRRRTGGQELIGLQDVLALLGVDLSKEDL